MTQQNFDDWFEDITGNRPYLYQKRLAKDELPIVIDVATGLGKTAAIVLAWLWRRKYSCNQALRMKTPRRLVYILPMRTLVYQTVGSIQVWLDKIAKNNQENDENRIEVYQLMGGAVSKDEGHDPSADASSAEPNAAIREAVSKDWDRDPSADCIIVGTQDQILSRCLNRGYSMNKYRWPVHFGLLNQDCLFVVDETQLMGAGLRTTAQLQGLRKTWKTYGVTQTVWMSATLDVDLLSTADHEPDLHSASARFVLNDSDREEPEVKKRLNAKKQLQKFSIACPAKEKDEAAYISALVQQIEAEANEGRTLILVICNRVRRAQALYSALISKRQTLLIHSRFRAGDRKEQNEQLLDGNLSGIVVATQAIEAGIDISAQCLFTELSPWSSFVQRVGRCNRKGEDNDATVYWIDFDDLTEESARPYELEELEQTRLLLNRLEQVGPEALQTFAKDLSEDEKPKSKIEGMIPRKHDLMQLFDTSVDLAGHDIDISCFIRDTKNVDVAIAWRTWSDEIPPADFPALQRDELCQIGIGAAKEFLKKAKGYVFDRLQNSWEPVDARSIYPGQMILVKCQDGGYLKTIGFTGDAKHKPDEIEIPLKLKIKPEGNDDDPLSEGAKSFVTLAQHSDDIVVELLKMLKVLKPDDLPVTKDDLPVAELECAARMHDAGKAHKQFQKMLTRNDEDKQKENLWAKSEGHKSSYEYDADRQGFRHELVSALLALQLDKPFLVSYLAACHHGKVRMTIQPRPTEQAPTNKSGPKRYALGVHEGDDLPEINLGIELGNKVVIPAMKVSLACMELGGTAEAQDNDDGTVSLAVRSWTEQAVELLENYGPFRLAFLEALIRTADWQASAENNTNLGGADA
jgi:CRISPR-associated endonuclease/helicase Cas3